jgi:CRISPR-associated protein Cas2
MVVIVTRDVKPRFRGFLTSCMLEIAPGVYTSPRMSVGVMDRVWAVISEWHDELDCGSIIMTWNNSTDPGQQGIRTLGTPPVRIIEHEGLHLVVKQEDTITE